MFDSLLHTLTENPFLSAATLTALLTFIGAGCKALFRRTKTSGQGGTFFTHSELLQPPRARPAYSDRMAYILAEMSALAYFRFEEPSDGAIEQALAQFRELNSSGSNSEENLRNILENFQDELLLQAVNSEQVLTNILAKADFELLETININGTQAFACRRNKPGENSYLVIAFRGTEKTLEDWLTDANALPAEGLPAEIKIHRGFWNALNQPPRSSDQGSDTVLQRVRTIIEKQNQESPLPCFITGHSLGGALALLTTRELAADIDGACYTYGAPRVANYEYFNNMKTPVYRLVNSSDIVPRVPPGAGMALLLKLIQGLNWLTQTFFKFKLPLMDWAEDHVDQLKDYRHHGDQRYLTDVRTGHFEDVRLLSNPPALDRMLWMWQHLRKSLREPVKSHGMAIYRHKLLHIARTRNPK